MCGHLQFYDLILIYEVILEGHTSHAIEQSVKESNESCSIDAENDHPVAISFSK